MSSPWLTAACRTQYIRSPCGAQAPRRRPGHRTWCFQMRRTRSGYPRLTSPGTECHWEYHGECDIYLVYGGDVDPVMLPRLLLDLVNAGLGLGHLAGSAHLDVAATHQDPVHLLQRQLRRLGLLELHECEALVLPCHGVPAHRDGANGPEW